MGTSAYAETYIASEQSEQVLTTTSTWEALSASFADGAFSNMEDPTSAGVLEVSDPFAGRYELSYDVVLQVTGPTAILDGFIHMTEEIIEIGVGVDASVNAKTIRPAHAAVVHGRVQATCSGAEVTLTAGQVLQLYARCTSNDAVGITVHKAFLKARQIA